MATPKYNMPEDKQKEYTERGKIWNSKLKVHCPEHGTQETYDLGINGLCVGWGCHRCYYKLPTKKLNYAMTALNKVMENLRERVNHILLGGDIVTPAQVDQILALLEEEYRRGYNDNARDCLCDELPDIPHHHLIDDGKSYHIKPDLPLTQRQALNKVKE